MMKENNSNKYIFNKGENHMIGFLIGIFVGGVIGVTVMAMMNIASESDKHEESDFDLNNAEI